MRNIVSSPPTIGAIFAFAIVALPSTAPAAPAVPSVDRSTYAALDSQNQAGFGATINFTDSNYTPPGLLPLFRGPLASLDQTGFGNAINFSASAYTPPGITSRSIEVVVAR